MPDINDPDWNFDDDHGFEPVLTRDVTVEVDEEEYIVDLERDSIDDEWCAVSTDAPLAVAKAAMAKAEREVNA